MPRVLVYGGSRGLRMDPATIKRQTGLTAFNFAFHNGRPEDAWAVTDWLLDNHPDKPPAVIWCLQATTLADVPMAPGLIVDERLSQAFPKALIDAKTKWAHEAAQAQPALRAPLRLRRDAVVEQLRHQARGGPHAAAVAEGLPRRRHARHGGQPQGPRQDAGEGILRRSTIRLLNKITSGR